MFTHSLGEIKTPTIQAGDDALDLALSGHGRHAVESPTGSATPTGFTVGEAETARSPSTTGVGDVASLGGLLAMAAEHAPAPAPALVRDRVRAAADACEQAARRAGAASR
ncbi:hypothetical protein ACWENO_30260 [Streptomyces sp. NPDC004436]